MSDERKWMVVDGSLMGEIEPFDPAKVTAKTVVLLDRPESNDLSGGPGEVPRWLWEKNKLRFNGRLKAPEYPIKGRSGG